MCGNIFIDTRHTFYQLSSVVYKIDLNDKHTSFSPVIGPPFHREVSEWKGYLSFSCIPEIEILCAVAYPGLEIGGCSARICNLLRMRRSWVGVASSVSTSIVVVRTYRIERKPAP